MDPENENTVALREYEASDEHAVVQFGLRAWAPAYDAWRIILGDSLYKHEYPDWRASQTAAIQHSTHANHAWVATENGATIGFVTVVLHDADRGEIDMLAVDPDRQRTGIGQKLIDTALDFMRAHGVTHAELGTGGDPGHAAARRAYERAGFVGLPLVHYYKQL